MILLTHYAADKNQLTHVDDALGAAVLPGVDLADQDVDNYTYTQIGELLSDDQEEIETIEWTVTEKSKKLSDIGKFKAKFRIYL